MRKYLFFLTIVFLFGIVAGCASSTDHQSRSNSSKKINSLNELNELAMEFNNNYRTSYETALARFDFTIYEMSDTVDVMNGKSYRAYFKENEQFNEVTLQTLEVYQDSDGRYHTTPLGAYIVTGFYDKEDKIYKDIIEKYSELTYERTDDYQFVHWVSSAGTYHRFVTVNEHNMIDENSLVANAKQFQIDYEDVLANPQVLPSYIPDSALERLREDYKDQSFNRTYTYFGNDRNLDEYILIVPVGTTSQEAIEYGNELFSYITEIKKGHPLFNEKEWEEHSLRLHVRHDGNDENFVTGRKTGLEVALDWGDDAVQAVENKDKETTVQEQIAKVRNQSIEGYSLADIQTFSMTNGALPEIVALFHENEMDGQSKLFVYQFDKNRNDWILAIDKEFFLAYDILETGDPFNNNLEQVAIGGYSGSGAFLEFVIVGSSNGKDVSILLDESDSSYGGGPRIVFLYEKIFIGDARTADEIASFQWNGSEYE